jgi:hypothetical protein
MKETSKDNLHLDCLELISKVTLEAGQVNTRKWVQSSKTQELQQVKQHLLLQISSKIKTN